MARSGTTWLGKLFDSHPDTLYRHEPDSWRLLPMPRYPTGAEGTEYVSLLHSFVAEMPHMNASRVAGKLPVFPKAYLSWPRARMIRWSIWLARIGHQFGRDIPVLMHSSATNYPRRRVVWKSIESLGRVGAALDALPDAKAIHILRHPCGVISSKLRGEAGGEFTHNTFHDLDYGIFHAAIGTPLGDEYGLSWEMLSTLRPEEQLAWRWVLVNEKALQEGGKYGRMLSIRYEDVCREPMERVEQMFEFAGLDVSEQTRAFVTASTLHEKRGYYSVFKDPMASATRWRQELDADTIHRVMAIVGRSSFADYYGVEPIVPKTMS